MVWRFLQSFGSAGGLSVGTAVIGDIYRLEERGTAMGIFFAVSVSFVNMIHAPVIYCHVDFHPQAVLLGPALAPFTGGALHAECSPEPIY